jgi:uncharacterized protein (TIGR03435 family)
LNRQPNSFPSFVRKNTLHVATGRCVTRGMRLTVGVLSVAAAFAQTAPAQAFDAATIKLNTAMDQPMGEYKNGRVIIHNMSLLSLIGGAYHVPNDYIFGPDWLDSVHLDVSAKTDLSTSEDDSRTMLRTLLEEKLKLEVHTETRTQAIYALRVARNGPKFSASKDDSGRRPGCVSYRPIRCYSVTLPVLLNALYQIAGPQLDLPVRDQTDLKGRYDVELSLEPDAAGDRGSVFYALQDQLGLKLEAVKQPIEAIVVDHVERTPIEK